MTEAKSRIKKIIEELQALLNSDKQEDEQPRTLLTGPCIAKTCNGYVVAVQRWPSPVYSFIYAIDGLCWSISKHGKHQRGQDQKDIVEVIRPLTEQEVLDWQFRGIEPDLSEASEFEYQLPEGFEHSDVGRKEAEQMGLIHLGRATSNGTCEVNGTLYYFDYWNNEWKPKPGDYRIWEIDHYAYKPAT